MAKIVLPKDIEDKENIIILKDENDSCLVGYSHCFGNDGGSGIPQSMKVAKGRGGEVEVWQLDGTKEKIEKKEIYNRCQYCQKYAYVKTKE